MSSQTQMDIIQLGYQLCVLYVNKGTEKSLFGPFFTKTNFYVVQNKTKSSQGVVVQQCLMDVKQHWKVNGHSNINLAIWI